jgi:tRNA/tmRNA/rRNA uracil-C5-methylase (TrmA/RlmC/RlmD family)
LDLDERDADLDQPAGAVPCGGCTWQHIAYPEQLRLKTALVSRLVGAAVPGAPAAQAMLATTPLETPWGYRRKVHFVFGNAGVSLVSWLAYLLAACLWFVYGFQKRDKTIYLACVGWIVLDAAIVAGVIVHG